MIKHGYTRREILKILGYSGIMASLPLPVFAQNVGQGAANKILKTIPSSGEKIPAIGMGTWITFNVGQDEGLRNQRTEILDLFFEKGGEMIDCSPMYGTSAEVLGYALSRTNRYSDVFAASKVWSSYTSQGKAQMQTQQNAWGVENFDLMQVHNLLNWESYLPILEEQKKNGDIRYLGITTSHGRRHDDLIRIMETRDLDFVQFTYNITHREAESILLPVAKERGIAVIVNRPFDGGGLFSQFEDKPLPGWAADYDIQNWAQLFLKFIVSHPAVTCAIPATSKLEHMRENMGALYGSLPDETARAKMVQYIENI